MPSVRLNSSGGEKEGEEKRGGRGIEKKLKYGKNVVLITFINFCPQFYPYLNFQ